MSAGPTDLVTQRLILRPVTTRAAAAIVDGPRDARWAAGYPTEGDREVAARVILAGDAKPAALGVRQVIVRDGHTTIGGIGFYGGPGPDGEIGVGYGLAAEWRGRGLATEALIAMVSLAAAYDDVVAVRAETTTDNQASRRVLEKSGFDLVAVEGNQLRYRRAVR